MFQGLSICKIKVCSLPLRGRHVADHHISHMFSLLIINMFAVFVQVDMEVYSVEENDGPVGIQLILNEMPGVAVNATVTTADLTAGMHACITIR